MARENRLAGEISPYLLMHRQNPVDWYPWGEEALRKARLDDKPIFLSVGYSTCYWCHVMERESFADAGTAEVMNESFVNIKVDREERPDIDEIYMAATQIYNQRGGWPNSVFLTPKLEPFFAGTYFPPHDHQGRPSFKTVLLSMRHAWQERRQDVDIQAAEMGEAMRRMLEERGAPGESPASADVAFRSRDLLQERFDELHGGFGTSTKFPSPTHLFLLSDLAAERDETSSRMLDATLDAMAHGGVYDQLAGGFHRYATDREWRVPHFEKMLYDNGLLLEAYGLAYSRTGDSERERILRETAAFLAREMTDERGCFKSAIDAEIEGREGEHHIWTLEQLTQVLGEEDAGFLAPLYGFADGPFFDRKYFVLHLPESIAEQAERRRSSPEDLWDQIRPLKEKLFTARLERPMPLVDDKVLTDWNGWTLAGLAVAGLYLEDPNILGQAIRAAEGLLQLARDEQGRLMHCVRDGVARIPAFLTDYVALVHGLLALHDATQQPRWLAEAERLTEEQIERLEDPESGGFYTASAQDDLLFRSKEIFDGATPSANGMAALNLLQLAESADRERWLPVAERTLRAFAPLVEQRPDGARCLALATYRYHRLVGSGSAEQAIAETVVNLVERASRAVVQTRLELGAADDQGQRAFELRLTVRDGWFIYGPASAEASAEELQATRLRAAGELLELHMPEPERKTLGDGDIELYRGEVILSGRLKGEPKLFLSFQPCDDRRCLQATEVEIVPS